MSKKIDYSNPPHKTPEGMALDSLKWIISDFADGTEMNIQDREKMKNLFEWWVDYYAQHRGVSIEENKKAVQQCPHWDSALLCDALNDYIQNKVDPNLFEFAVEAISLFCT
jgi:hypothetical protein